jgi:hypothetical protein
MVPNQLKQLKTNNMRLNVELIEIDIYTKGRSWISILEINHGNPLFYMEWGQGMKIQISFLFGLLKNY